ncbi:MAG: relaxase/mobilization nuclease domain-containing protein [Candidatus Pacebacteria bacterium]|nr:relaxase/mobilization nuclease domain-containing protein [Candidatus Paceibacterota bacterium]
MKWHLSQEELVRMGRHKQHISFFENEEEGFKQDRHDRDNVSFASLNNRLSNSYYWNDIQSKKLEVVIKITSSGRGATAVKRLTDYIARDISKEDAEKLLPKDVIEERGDEEKLSIELDTGEILSNKEERDYVIDTWASDFVAKESYEKQSWKNQRLKELKDEKKLLMVKDYEEKTTASEVERLKNIESMIREQYFIGDNGKRYSLKVYAPRDTIHMVLSIGGKQDERNRLAAKRAIRQYLSENYGEFGFRYMFVEHNDTNNLHYHVVIKSANELTKRHLSFDRADLFLQRQELARVLDQEGIERSATLRRDRQYVLERVEQGLERLHEKQGWYQSLLSSNDNNERGADIFKFKSQALKHIRYYDSVLKVEADRLFGSKVIDLDKKRQTLKAIKKDLLRRDSSILIKDVKISLQRMGADYNLIKEKTAAIEYDYNFKRSERYKAHLKELMAQHRNDIKFAKTTYKEKGGKDHSIIDQLKGLESSVKRIQEQSRGIERDDSYKSKFIQEALDLVNQGNAVQALESKAYEMYNKQVDMEASLSSIFPKSQDKTLKAELKHLKERREWLKKVLIPAVRQYQKEDHGHSLQAFAELKEASYLERKERQQTLDRGMVISGRVLEFSKPNQGNVELKIDTVDGVRKILINEKDALAIKLHKPEKIKLQSIAHDDRKWRVISGLERKGMERE